MQPMPVSNSRFYHSVAGQTGPAAIGFREGFALFWALGLTCFNSYLCRDLFRNPTAFMNSMHGFWVALAGMEATRGFNRAGGPSGIAACPSNSLVRR
jgi:hypothetical protein